MSDLTYTLYRISEIKVLTKQEKQIEFDRASMKIVINKNEYKKYHKREYKYKN